MWLHITFSLRGVPSNVPSPEPVKPYHIEQKQTRFGPQAYIRDTRVAVRHVAAFLKAGHSAEEIINTGLPHLSPAAIYEAIAYYYDHQAEIEAELAANTPEAVGIQLQKLLSPTDYAIVTGRS